MPTAKNTSSNIISPIECLLDVLVDDQITQIVDLYGCSLNSILAPAGLTSTFFSLLGSLDGENFYPLEDASGNFLSFNIDTDPHLFYFNIFQGIRWVRISLESAEESDATFLLGVTGALKF